MTKRQMFNITNDSLLTTLEVDNNIWLDKVENEDSQRLSYKTLKGFTNV